MSARRDPGWDGCRNVRDLGGIVLEDGARTMAGVLVRADDLSLVTARGRDRAIADGLRTIVDLRFPAERVARPAPWSATAVGVVQRPLLVDDDPVALDRVRAAASAAEAYLATVDGFGRRIVAALVAIAEAPPGLVAVHCSGGVDRTGLTVALLLRAIGAPLTAVADDYAVAPAHALADEVPGRATITAVVEEVERRHGSIAGYLAAQAAPARFVAALRARLTGAGPKAR